MNNPSPEQPVVLITGGARRIGAAIARRFNQAGCQVVIHYNQSGEEADDLALELNGETVQADLTRQAEVEKLAQSSLDCFGRIDYLINNASSYYPTPLPEASQAQWDDLVDSNDPSVDPASAQQYYLDEDQDGYSSGVEVGAVQCEPPALGIPLSEYIDELDPFVADRSAEKAVSDLGFDPSGRQTLTFTRGEVELLLGLGIVCPRGPIHAVVATPGLILAAHLLGV